MTEIDLVKMIARWYVEDCKYSIKMADSLNDFNINIANVSFPSTKKIEKLLDSYNSVATDILLEFVASGHCFEYRNNGKLLVKLTDLEDVLNMLFDRDQGDLNESN